MTERFELAVVNVNDPSIPYQSEWLDTVRSHFESVAAPGTTVSMYSPEPPALRRAADTVVPYFMYLNNRNILEQVYEANQAEADAIFIACSEDPVLTEARTLVDVPVSGAAESTLFFTGTLGHRFGLVVPQDQQLAHIWDELVRSYGLSDRCAGIYQLDQPFHETFTEGWADLETVVDAIEAAAADAVAAGADSIVLGSGGLGSMATAAGLASLDENSVPVLDVLTVGFKLLEAKTRLVAELGLPSVSRAHGRRQIPEDDRRRVRSLFGLESEE